jgi:segregation and condensation protein B
MTDRSEMEAAVEAVLFVSAQPVPRDRLAAMFEEEERGAANDAVGAVLDRYRDGAGRGVFVEEVAGGLRLVTRPEMNGWLRRFFEVSGGQKLSMAALETLAIVAYRQPLTAPEIQDLRGVNPSGVLKTLLERRLVRIAGRKEVVGRPFLYCTTREFLVHFGLKSISDLPPLEEFEEAFAESGEGGGESPPEGGLEAGPGVDREEGILRRAAALEESEGVPRPGAEPPAGPPAPPAAPLHDPAGEMPAAAAAVPDPDRRP